MVGGRAGWHPDPYRTHELRYFDGSSWTEHVSDQGRQGTEAFPLTWSPSDAGVPVAPSRARAARFSLADYSVATRVAVFVGCGLLIVGAFLPWVKATVGLFSIKKDGIDGDGVLTLLTGAAALLVFCLVRSTAGRMLVLLAACFAVVVSLYDVVDVQSTADDIAARAGSFSIQSSVGIGLWLSALGALALLLGALLAFRDGMVASRT